MNKKRPRKDSKKKKKRTLLGCSKAVGQSKQPALILGESSSSASHEEAEEEDEMSPVDKASIFALPAREMSRVARQLRADDLSVKQLAYAIAGTTEFCVPSDLIEIGGDKDSGALVGSCCFTTSRLSFEE